MEKDIEQQMPEENDPFLTSHPNSRHGLISAFLEIRSRRLENLPEIQNGCGACYYNREKPLNEGNNKISLLCYIF